MGRTEPCSKRDMKYARGSVIYGRLAMSARSRRLRNAPRGRAPPARAYSPAKRAGDAPRHEPRRTAWRTASARIRAHQLSPRRNHASRRMMCSPSRLDDAQISPTSREKATSSNGLHLARPGGPGRRLAIGRSSPTVVSPWRRRPCAGPHCSKSPLDNLPTPRVRRRQSDGLRSSYETRGS